MAPRGRQRKIGLRRIDAAVDALEPLGFPKAVVCKTVNSLLKVYGGDDGWRFIEEASYQLVIDTILEQQQEEEEKQEKLGLPEKGPCENNARNLDACASTQIDWGQGGEEHVAAAREDEMCQPASNVDDDDDGKHSSDRVIGENIEWKYSSSMHLNTGQLTESTISGSEGLHSEASHNIAGEVSGQNSESCGIGPSHLQSAKNHFFPRRKPCFGWISDEDGNQDVKAEENCVISLNQKHEPAQSPNTLWCKGRRKS